MSATVTLGFATVATAIALLLVAVSFSTDQWIVDVVNRDQIRKSAVGDAALNTSLYKYPYYHTRHTGLFRTCFPGTDNKFLDQYSASQIVDGNCLYVDYEIPEKQASLQYSSDYWARIHLMRAQFAFFVVALLFLVIACISGAVGCWRLSSTVVKVTGLIAFIAAFFTAAGMAFFHGAEYLERNKIKTNTGEFYPEWPKVLSQNTVRSYGWSYILGWIGMVFAAIAAILFLVAGYSIQNKHRKGQEKVPYDDYTMQSRNKSYDYMEHQRGPYPGPRDDFYGAQPYTMPPPNYGPSYPAAYPSYYY